MIVPLNPPIHVDWQHLMIEQEWCEDGTLNYQHYKYQHYKLGSLPLDLRPELPKHLAVSWATVCHLHGRDGDTGGQSIEDYSITAAAFCSVHDKFNREEGRKMSLTRALAMSGFDRTLRRAVWEAYWARCPGKVDPAFKALKNLYKLVESGYLVRDTAHDGDKDWVLHQFAAVEALRAANQLVHPEPETGGNA